MNLRVVLCLVSMLYGSVALAGKIYAPEQLKRLVESGSPPAQGAVSSQSTLVSFSNCQAHVSQVIRDAGGRYPYKTVLNTSTVLIQKIWTNDGAITMTCSAADGKLVVTTAPYL